MHPLDGYVEGVMRQWAVPGLAIAVVKDGKIVLEKGYGVRQAGRQELVDEHTIFEIGSMTKSFTTTAVALLVDEGKLQWNSPVTAYLPGFQFSDPWITTHATLEDIAAHRVGIDANLVWSGASRNRDVVLDSVRHLTPASHFGEYFYSNTGMMILGKLIEQASGQRWEDFLVTRLFSPLNMTRSSTERQTYIPPAQLAPCWLCTPPPGAKAGLGALDRRERNVAAPHGLSVLGNRPPGQGRQAELWPWRDDRPGPAGAINSTAHDLAQWLIVHIGQGDHQGRRLFSPAQARQMHAPHVIMDQPQPTQASLDAENIVSLGYGYGWRVELYRGHRMLHHGGGEVGFGSFMAFFPNERLGIVVLENMDYRDTRARIPITRRLADHYLGLAPLDWASQIATDWSLKHEGRELDPEERLLRQPSRPEAIQRYLGDYTHPAIGAVSIKSEHSGLVLELEPRSRADIHLRDRQNGIAIFRGADRWQMSIQFTFDAAEQAKGFVLGERGELYPLGFDRVEDARTMNVLGERPMERGVFYWEKAKTGLERGSKE